MSFPALLEASDDPIVRRRRNATVYLYLVKRLDFREFRRVMARRLGRELGMRPQTVGAALKTLGKHGYLERGPKVMDTWTYRLVYARSERDGPNKPSGVTA